MSDITVNALRTYGGSGQSVTEAGHLSRKTFQLNRAGQSRAGENYFYEHMA